MQCFVYIRVSGDSFKQAILISTFNHSMWYVKSNRFPMTSAKCLPLRQLRAFKRYSFRRFCVFSGCLVLHSTNTQFYDLCSMSHHSQLPAVAALLRSMKIKVSPKWHKIWQVWNSWSNRKRCVQSETNKNEIKRRCFRDVLVHITWFNHIGASSFFRFGCVFSSLFLTIRMERRSHP